MLAILKNIAEALGAIGLLASGSLIGALITTFINHHFDREKLKTERGSLLAKEIYFRLQDKTEEIRFGMQVLNRRAVTMVTEIKLKIEHGIISSPDLKDDFLEERINVAVYLETYFPQVNTGDYNDCIDILPKLAHIYKKFKDHNGILDKADLILLNELIKTFASKMAAFSNQIQVELDRAKIGIK